MSEQKVTFKELAFRDSSNALNENADGFAYSSFGNGESRVGSIAFFKHVSDWVNNDEIQTVRYQIANIRMSERQLLELAEFIKYQHEASKKAD
ncbi:hypothetical protein ACQ9K0_17805 [Klebsiella michiganensis]|uniref:hypothetical protein n=1 Tax=Klebsiella michiganensis TaxID=1134687 RepID=UPI0012B87FDA|nr:hypothetical protein [Klebsiella michiganensis]MBX4651394.1 hypothetical protein [Klebsiella michiganensis]MDU2361752.1 hypothetical protein [Klebsiella michiganensis]MDU2413053.1 hypothetical protein [Klebsiella michiganensis]